MFFQNKWSKIVGFAGMLYFRRALEKGGLAQLARASRLKREGQLPG
jgi:hypothetical protein